MAGTLPVTAQSPKEMRILGAPADLEELLKIVAVAHGALDQAHIDALRILLDVDHRAVDDVHLAGQVDQEFVQVEERHVAAGAAAQPDCGYSLDDPLFFLPGVDDEFEL
jgi:hypothetical protein